MKQHPLSAAFPSMSETDFQSLAQDIALNGLKQPVVIYEDKVLDGWHRYTACVQAGMTPKVVQLEQDEDPVAFVLSMNMNRRHLTASQRAAAVVKCADWRGVGSNQHDGGSAPGAEALAEQADVSVRTLHQAKAAHDAGLGDLVRDGEVSAKEAADLAKGRIEPTKPSRAKKPAAAKKEGDCEHCGTPIDTTSEGECCSGAEEASLEATLAEMQKELEIAERIIEADDKVAAVYLEVKAMRAKHDAIEKLYNNQRTELTEMTREAGRWKRKAEDLEKQLKKGGK